MANTPPLLLLLLLLTPFSTTTNTQTSLSPSPLYYPLSFPNPPTHRRIVSSPTSPLVLTRAPVISMNIGTPPKLHHLVLDTGSELTWINCTTPPPSSSLSPLPCSSPFCNPSPSLNIGIQCSSPPLPHRCLYDFLYADSTQASGSLFQDTFPTTHATKPIVLGCADRPENESGILGMNMGPLSFPSQASLSLFSICLSPRYSELSPPSLGLLHPGPLPPSFSFNQTALIDPDPAHHPPDYDPHAYMVPLSITVGDALLPRLNGSTTERMALLDSASEFTLLDKEGYEGVKKVVMRKAGRGFKAGFQYKGALEMCFDVDWRGAARVGRRIGGMRLGFGGEGVGVGVEGDRLLRQVEKGVYCVPVGRLSEEPGPLSLVGLSLLQGNWVQYDLKRRMVGIRRFTSADDCRRLPF